MSTIQEIEHAVSRLPLDELGRFREWYEKFDAQVWDRQFEADAKSGKLDKLGEQAIQDFRDGKYRPV